MDEFGISTCLTHSLRFDIDTASKIVVHFMSTNKEPSEEYNSKQYDRLMKYYERNTTIHPIAMDKRNEFNQAHKIIQILDWDWTTKLLKGSLLNSITNK